MSKYAKRRWDGVDAVAYVQDIRGRRRPVTEPMDVTLEEGERLVFLTHGATMTILDAEQERLARWC